VEDVVTDGGEARPIVTTALRPTWSESAERRATAPGVGENSDQVLSELGYTPAEIARLRQRQIV
jgi:crotonobetainyl-CoA:carnitine CoA-transferase CaiB-like acyl-CoA transferase